MKIIECPRDAMQGLEQFVPTATKIAYINALLRVGFDTIDFGSFVSPKAIPQMRDTMEVLASLDLNDKTQLLAIVANLRGAESACDFEEIQYLGYPLSLSETFQQRNTNRSINHALSDLAEIQDLCDEADKTLVVYLSMGFGNPYGDPYELDYIGEFVQKLDNLEVGIISLADTIGVAQTKDVSTLFSNLIPQFPHIEFGAHLHSKPEAVHEKVEAAYRAGCRRIDGALRGFGGCPMATDNLTGNMPTENILTFLEQEGLETGIDKNRLEVALKLSAGVFG